jgi:hypothetical protein
LFENHVEINRILPKLNDGMIIPKRIVVGKGIFEIVDKTKNNNR